MLKDPWLAMSKRDECDALRGRHGHRVARGHIGRYRLDAEFLLVVVGTMVLALLVGSTVLVCLTR